MTDPLAADKRPDFRYLDHTADLGIVVRGPSPSKLFEEAARSMMWVMIRAESSDLGKRREISVMGQDWADLMVRWLGEILYLFHGEKEVLMDVRVRRISEHQVDAVLDTHPYDPRIHEIDCDLKAVTYHLVEVAPKGDHWEAKVIFDI